jgi:acyl-CoA thioesterase
MNESNLTSKVWKQDQNQPKTGPYHIVLPEWISCAPFERLLGMDIVEAKDGRAILSMPFRYEFAQGAGLMHGGALVTLADTAVVMAIKSMVPGNTHFATIRLESEFLYPVRQGIVTAKAAARRDGDRTIEGEATVFDDAERAVLSFRSMFKIAREPKIRGNSE